MMVNATITPPQPPPPGTVHWERYTDEDLSLMEFAISAFGWHGREGIERLIHYLGYENEDELLKNWRSNEPERQEHGDLLSLLFNEGGRVLYEEAFECWRWTSKANSELPPPNAKYRDWYQYQWNLKQERAKAFQRRLRRACANHLGMDESRISDVASHYEGGEFAGFKVIIVIPTGDDPRPFIELHAPQTSEG